MRSERPSYMTALREEAVYPSFDHVATMVRAHTSKRVRFFLLPILGCVLLVAAGVLFLQMGSMEGGVRSTIAAHSSPVTSPSVNTSVPSQPVMVHATRNPHATHLPVSHEDPTPDVHFESLSSGSLERVSIANEQTPSIEAEEPTLPSIALHTNMEHNDPILGLSAISSRQDGEAQWQAFASAGIRASQQPISQQLTGSVGMRYALDEHAWLVLELRRNPTIESTGGTTVYRDTSITLNGTTYTNTIGSLSPSIGGMNANVSLAAGYRYAVNGIVAPVAEVLAGGSLHGILLASSLGLQYHFLASYCLEASARLEQLTALHASPVRSLTANVGVSYAW